MKTLCGLVFVCSFGVLTSAFGQPLGTPDILIPPVERWVPNDPAEGSFARLALKTPAPFRSDARWVRVPSFERAPESMSAVASSFIDIAVTLPTQPAAMLLEPAVSAVPEPSTYAMLIAGVAFIGFVARKRIPR